MSTIISGIGQSKVLSNLDTYTHTAGLTSLYTVQVRANEIPPSGLIITIQQNGTQQAITSVPAASQNHVDLRLLMNCVANDVINVILSSAVASDALMQSVKATLRITPGQV